MTCTGSFFAYLKFCIYFRIVYACVRIRNGRHCVSCRHICRLYNLHPHQQRCAYTISSPTLKPKKLPHPSLCVFKIFHAHHPCWRRYTFLSHLTTKSKISVRWIKKLVAATCGVCMFIHKLSPPHITPHYHLSIYIRHKRLCYL